MWTGLQLGAVIATATWNIVLAVKLLHVTTVAVICSIVPHHQVRQCPVAQFTAITQCGHPRSLGCRAGTTSARTPNLLFMRGEQQNISSLDRIIPENNR